MRPTRSLFNAMDEAHLFVTARAYGAVAAYDAPNAFVEDGAAISAPHADFHVVDGIVHGAGPADRAHAAPA